MAILKESKDLESFNLRNLICFYSLRILEERLLESKNIVSFSLETVAKGSRENLINRNSIRFIAYELNSKKIKLISFIFEFEIGELEFRNILKENKKFISFEDIGMGYESIKSL